MGRTSLMLVIAFNLTFMAMGLRTASIASSAYNKYIGYNNIEQASLAAESAANIAISNAFFSPATAIPTTTVSFTPGEVGTIRIQKTALKDASSDTTGFNIVVTGVFKGVTTLSTIDVTGNSFSKYVMFSESEKIGTSPIYWVTGDVCRGNFHTQDYVYVNGNPIFKGKVTTKLGLKKKNKSDKPVFEQNYTTGVDLPMNGNLDNLKYLGNNGGASYTNVKTFVEFMANGKVTVRTLAKTSTKDGWLAKPSDPAVSGYPACSTYASVSALTASGVLLVSGAELHIKGVLDGKITLGAVGTGSSVSIDSSVVLLQRPPTSEFPTNVSDDLLGIVSENDIRITDTAHPQTTTDAAGNPPNYAAANNNNNNSTKGVDIDASMYILNGGFGAERYDTRGNCGTLRVRGGIQQKERNPVGISSSPMNGFLKDYAYDLNLQFQSPKGYPITRFAISRWADNTIIDTTFWNE